MRVREALGELRARLDQLGVAELLGAQGVAERPSRRVLVRDVDVAALPAEGIGAQAGRVPEPRGGLGLALRPRPALPSRGTIFRATSSPVCSSRASQTEPLAPLPKGRSGR